ncbi:hypothetical protein OG216_47485 (plasmid) [Streptomycetaceae bacterium NBC_01309]
MTPPRTRNQAIAQGLLVEADPKICAEYRMTGIPIALTAAAYERCVAWTEDDARRGWPGTTEADRLRDVVAVVAEKFADFIQAGDQDEAIACFSLHLVAGRAGAPSPFEVRLLADIHDGGDHGSHAVTVDCRSEF